MVILGNRGMVVAAILKYRKGHGTGKTAGNYLQVLERGDEASTHRVRTAWSTPELAGC